MSKENNGIIREIYFPDEEQGDYNPKSSHSTVEMRLFLNDQYFKKGDDIGDDMMSLVIERFTTAIDGEFYHGKEGLVFENSTAELCLPIYIASEYKKGMDPNAIISDLMEKTGKILDALLELDGTVGGELLTGDARSTISKSGEIRGRLTEQLESELKEAFKGGEEALLTIRERKLLNSPAIEEKAIEKEPLTEKQRKKFNKEFPEKDFYYADPREAFGDFDYDPGSEQLSSDSSVRSGSDPASASSSRTKTPEPKARSNSFTEQEVKRREQAKKLGKSDLEEGKNR